MAQSIFFTSETSGDWDLGLVKHKNQKLQQQVEALQRDQAALVSRIAAESMQNQMAAAMLAQQMALQYPGMAGMGMNPMMMNAGMGGVGMLPVQSPHMIYVPVPMHPGFQNQMGAAACPPIPPPPVPRQDVRRSKLGHSDEFFEVNTLKVFQNADSRTTLIIKNIPNKYTQSMMLNELDTVAKGEYDLFYLPVDFDTKCNMGYAFVNVMNPLSVISIYEAFNGKKWSMFKSAKVCNVAYARIQGLEGLTKKLCNSKAMSKDESLRPLWFDKNGPIHAPPAI